MKKITGLEFVEMWKSASVNGDDNLTSYSTESVFEIQDCEIDGNVELSIDKKIIGAVFARCVFNGSIDIKGGGITNDTIGSIYFIESKVNYIRLDGVIVKEISINHKSSVHSIRILNSKVENTLEVLNGANFTAFHIQQSKAKNMVLGSTVPLGIIDISEDSVIGSIVAEKINLYSLNITNSRIENKVDFLESIINHAFHILDNSAVEKIFLNNTKINSGVYIRDSKVSNLDIRKSHLVDVQIFQKTEINLMNVTETTVKDIFLTDTKLIDLKISEKSKVAGLSIKQTNECRLIEISKSIIQKVDIIVDKPIGISFFEADIWNLYIGKSLVSRDSVIRFSDSQINTVVIDSVVNLGMVIFNNINPLATGSKFKIDEQGNASVDKNGNYTFEDTVDQPTLFQLINSDLGKTTFINCNLNAFDQFVFLNTKMLETFVADTVLPLAGKIETVEGKSEVAKLEQQRLALGQFKKIYENRGDVVKALEYHAQEMEVYRDYLREQKKEEYQREGHTKRLRFLNLTIKAQKAVRELTRRFTARGERLVLFLNSASNFHGTNWVRAIAVTIVMGWVLFAFYCRCLGFRFGPDVGRFWELFSYSFEFINPLRKADFLEQAFLDSHKEPLYPVTPGARIVDYAARIIMAYMVYQTIQAFRKFGKKAV